MVEEKKFRRYKIVNGKRKRQTLQRPQIGKYIRDTIKKGGYNKLINRFKGEFDKQSKEFDDLFPYTSWKSDKINKALSIDTLKAVMNDYAFDSCDAMISNFFLSSPTDAYSGLVTCDKAFIRLHKVRDIFVPEGILKSYNFLTGQKIEPSTNLIITR